jgi:hypothetical protein
MLVRDAPLKFHHCSSDGSAECGQASSQTFRIVTEAGGMVSVLVV